MIIVDVNLLLYAVVDGFAEHVRARRWWVETVNSDAQIGLGAPAVFGFLRLVTSRRVVDPPLGLTAALDHVRGWLVRPNVWFLPPGPGHVDIAFDLLRAAGSAGNLTTDVQVAALAVEHDATVYSHDTDFGRFPEVRWIDPLR